MKVACGEPIARSKIASGIGAALIVARLRSHNAACTAVAAAALGDPVLLCAVLKSLQILCARTSQQLSGLLRTENPSAEPRRSCARLRRVGINNNHS